MMLGREEISKLIDDQPHKSFTVDRRVFTDERIFEAEMKTVFEGTWVFIGLETQLPEPNSFFTTYIGRQPVLVMRDDNGEIGCFYNSCRHRGMLVCLAKQGTQRIHVCRYHNWTYDSGGRNRNVTSAKEGAYGSEFEKQDHGLVPVARFASYRGLMFASANPDVPSLEDHLGDAKVFLDLIVDQSPTGQLELIPGPATYIYEGNWKLQFENGLDAHHFPAVHASYIEIMAKRAERGLAGTPVSDEDGDVQGSFCFERGHAVAWSAFARGFWGKPLSCHAGYLESLQARVGKERAKWMLRYRNLTIFPNLQIVDVQTAQLRTWRPLSAHRTEMSAHCLGVVGESREARRFRMREYEHFFDSTGIASSDDNMMYELSQAGYAAEAAGRTQGYQRGMGLRPETAERAARELGIAGTDGLTAPLRTDPEAVMHAGYREWQRLLAAGTTR